MTWTTFTTELDPDKPARSVDIKAINANITAQANGDSGAPKQKTAGLEDDAVTAPKLAETSAERTWVRGRAFPAPATSAGTLVELYSNATSESTDNDTATKTSKFWPSALAGTVRVTFDLESSVAGRTAIAEVRVNGSTVSSHSTSNDTPTAQTADITVNVGDQVSLWIRDDGGLNNLSTVTNFLIRCNYS